MEQSSDFGVQDGTLLEDMGQSSCCQSSNCLTRESTAAEYSSGRTDGQAPTVANELASTTLELPSESRFKQLASLHLLRTAYQRDDEMGSNRLSMERVLESAQRQNMAQRVRLSFLQQQISLQLRITEAQERHMGELLHDLRSLNMRSGDLSAHEDTVLQIIEDLNDVRAGNLSNTVDLAAFLAEGARYGAGGDQQSDMNPIPSFYQVCVAFAKGRASTTFLQLSLNPFAGGRVSLQEIASYSRDLISQVLQCYLDSVNVQLALVHSSDRQEAAQALSRSERLTKELITWRSCFVIGQPSSFRPHWKSNMANVPVSLMKSALDRGELRQDQLITIERYSRQHRETIVPLREAEQRLKGDLRGEIHLASGVPDSQGLYLPMMHTVSELKANQAAQANSAVIFNGRCVDHVLDSLQTARMISCVAPYQFRPDMLLEAGLMLLEPDQPLAISQ